MAQIMERWEQATTEEEENRALKWFLLAPQLFLREPKRGGTKGQGHAAINARFEAARAGNWGELMAMMVQDREELALQSRNRENRTEDKEQEEGGPATEDCAVSTGQGADQPGSETNYQPWHRLPGGTLGEGCFEGQVHGERQRATSIGDQGRMCHITARAPGVNPVTDAWSLPRIWRS